MASKIKYTLEIDDNGFVKVVKQATDGVDGLDKAVKKTSTDGSTSMKSLTTSVRDVTLAFNGAVQMIGTVYNQMKEFTDASNAQVEAQRTLTEEQIAYSQTLEEQTGVSDVVISQAQSMLKVMGLNNEETQQATKYTADLVNQGKSLEDATKKASAMITHNYGELGELIPAIKTATTEQEKQSLAMDYFARISDKSIEKMNGVEGAEIRMKNSIQDAKEEFGSVVNKALIPLMKALTPVVELIGDNMPVAVGILGTVLTAVAIPKIIATTTALYAQATALTMATGGMNLLVTGITALAVGGSVALWANMSNGAKEAGVQLEGVSEKYERLKNEISNAEAELAKSERRTLDAFYGAQDIADKQLSSKNKLITMEQEYADKQRQIQNEINADREKHVKSELDSINNKKESYDGVLGAIKAVYDVARANGRIISSDIDSEISRNTKLIKLKQEQSDLMLKQKEDIKELQSITKTYNENAKDWAAKLIRDNAVVEAKQAELRVLKMALEEEEDIQREKKRNDAKIKAEEDRLKEIENTKQRNATSLSLIKQYQDKVSQIDLEGSSLAIQQEMLNNENTLNNLKEMLNQKKITYEAYHIAIKSQEQLHSEAIKAILDKENEDVLARIADANIAVLKKQQELAHSQLAIQEQYNKDAMKLEEEKLASSDVINQEIEDMLVASTKTKTDDLILAYNRDVNAYKDMLAKEKISQQEFDAWLKLRNQQFEEDSIDSYKEIAQQVGDILKDAFKDLFNFDNEAWEEQKQALQEQREQSDLDYQDRIEKINAELQVESSTAEERRALLREKAKLEKDYAKEKAKLSKQEEEQDALKNDRFKEMTKNAIKASIDMLAAKGAAAAFAQVMMNVPFPANIVLAPLAYAGAYTAISAAKMLFKKGGYTGDGNPDDEAGIVHKKEFVATAETTDRVGIPALEALQDGKATIVPITPVSKPDTFTGSVNTGYVANAVQALSMNLVGSDNSNSRETVIINNSDLVTITKKIEQVKSENKNMSTNKTTRSYR